MQEYQSSRPARGRKACRKDVKRTLKRIGWAPPKPDGLRGDDVTKMWLAARCAACRRCPKFSARLAAWTPEKLVGG